MKIPSALEEMVAGLISDEKERREEVEAVLSKVHEMTEAYFNPDITIQAVAPLDVKPEHIAAALPEEEFVPAPPVSLERQLSNMKRFNMVRGDDEFTAERKAKMALGIED